MPGLEGQASQTMEKFIGIVVLLALAGATIGLVFTNLGTVAAAFATPATGDTTLDAIIPAFGLLVGVLIVLGVVARFRNISK